MARALLLGLLLLGTACAPRTGVTPEPEDSAGRVGVLVPPRGRCTGVVIGAAVRRVCLPGRGRAQPADTVVRDTMRTPVDTSRIAGPR